MPVLPLSVARTRDVWKSSTAEIVNNIPVSLWLASGTNLTVNIGNGQVVYFQDFHYLELCRRVAHSSLIYLFLRMTTFENDTTRVRLEWNRIRCV